MTTLLERIEEARKAQEQIDAMAAVQEKADELPFLLEQRRREREIAEANARLEAVRANVKARLEEAKSGASKFRQSFAELALEFEALISAMPGLQAGILAAGRDLQSAVEAAHKVKQVKEPSAEMATGIPDYILDKGDLIGEWERAGGTDPALACLPEMKPGTVAYLLAELLQRKSATAYDPAQGARVFMPRY